MGRVVLGMIGLGTVGTGVVQLLSQQRHLSLKKVAVRDTTRQRPIKLPCPITSNVDEVLDDPEIEVLIEVAGGEQPALSYIQKAISKHKHVVTANKEVLAKHGPELFQLARNKGVAIFFEASVAGGIPLISTIHKGLEANQLSCVTGILNGTTNFILSQMEENQAGYEDALKQAQALGFAEADPTNDVDGHDVAYKLSILSALSYGSFVRPESIYTEGIRQIRPEDIAQAKEFGYRIKLVGTARPQEPEANTPGGGCGKSAGAHCRLDVRVHPMLIPLSHPLASVSGCHNGILVRGDAVGEIAIVGPGAGQMPTASAVVGDIINLSSALQLPDFATYFQPPIATTWAETADPGDWTCPYYLRLSVSDTPGSIGQLGTIFGKYGISIRSIIQRGVDQSSATIVILTHEVRNSNMQSAIAELKSSDFLTKLSNCIRIFQPDSKYA